MPRNCRRSKVSSKAPATAAPGMARASPPALPPPPTPTTAPWVRWNRAITWPCAAPADSHVRPVEHAKDQRVVRPRRGGPADLAGRHRARLLPAQRGLPLSRMGPWADFVRRLIDPVGQQADQARLAGYNDTLLREG